MNTLRKFKISTNLSWNFKAMGFATNWGTEFVRIFDKKRVFHWMDLPLTHSLTEYKTLYLLTCVYTNTKSNSRYFNTVFGFELSFAATERTLVLNLAYFC